MPSHGRIGGLLLAGLLATTAAEAAGPKGTFAIKGAGTSRCENYLAQLEGKTPEFYAFAGWIEGYLTAINGYQKDTFDIAPWQDTKLLALLLANHCRKHPNQTFFQAVRAMAQALYPQRLQAPSETVVARNGNRAIRAYRSVVERLQRKLKERGLYKGAPNGSYDKATRDAVLAFQKEEKLRTTGLPDAATLLRAFNSKTSDSASKK